MFNGKPEKNGWKISLRSRSRGGSGHHSCTGQEISQLLWHESFTATMLCEYLIGHADQKKTIACDTADFHFLKKAS